MLLPSSQRLLKANAARELGTRIAYNFEDLRQQGESYLADIQAQAEALLHQARSDAARIREETYREAREAARKDGLQDAARLIEQQSASIAGQQLSDRVGTVLPLLNGLVAEMNAERDRWRLRWETTALRTAVAIAEKLLHRTIHSHPEAAAEMIRETLKLAAGQPELRIHLHPDDLRFLGDQADAVVRTLTGCAKPELIPDPALRRGDCRIETRHGEIDARIETMLERIAEELLA
jgi:flagellar assembly protein FliH